MPLLDKEGHINLGILVNCRFNHLESLLAQLILKATQNLSGVLAVRSSGEDKYQRDNLAPVLAEVDLATTWHVDADVGSGPWNLRLY